MFIYRAVNLALHGELTRQCNHNCLLSVLRRMMVFRWDPDSKTSPRSDISNISFSEDSIDPDSLSDISVSEHETMETLHQPKRFTKYNKEEYDL